MLTTGRSGHALDFVDGIHFLKFGPGASGRLRPASPERISERVLPAAAVPNDLQGRTAGRLRRPFRRQRLAAEGPDALSTTKEEHWMPALEDPVWDFPAGKAVGLSLARGPTVGLDLADVRGKNGTLVMFICNPCPYVRGHRRPAGRGC